MDSGTRPPLLVVDAANVIGSVPDGWWRDRAAAVERLRDGLADVPARGLGGAVPDWLRRPPIEVVLVVEGAARGVPGGAAVRVVAAEGSGDDAIVALVAAEGGGRRCAVATADRELRSRVAALGAEAIGPRLVHPAHRVRAGPEGPAVRPGRGPSHHD